MTSKLANASLRIIFRGSLACVCRTRILHVIGFYVFGRSRCGLHHRRACLLKSVQQCYHCLTNLGCGLFQIQASSGHSDSFVCYQVHGSLRIWQLFCNFLGLIVFVQEFLHHISPRLYVRVYKFGFVAVIYRSSIVFRWHASNSLSSFCCGFAVCFCMLRNHFGACPHITLPFMGPRKAHGCCVLLVPRSGNQHTNIPI